MALIITCTKCNSTKLIQNPRLNTNKKAKELKCLNCGTEQQLKVVGYIETPYDYE